MWSLTSAAWWAWVAQASSRGSVGESTSKEVKGTRIGKLYPRGSSVSYNNLDKLIHYACGVCEIQYLPNDLPYIINTSGIQQLFEQANRLGKIILIMVFTFTHI